MQRSYAPLRYAPPVDYLLQQMKFHQKLELVPLMAELIAGSVSRREGELPQVLLPVPLHHTRLRERGYNQALELAREISGRLGIPVDWQTCRRQRNTLAQTSLQGKERRSNLKGAFESLGGLPSHVAIIDDVVTTGATVQEFAKTLRKAGVETVEVWACARAGAMR
jgi:ComF family protein